MQEICDGFARAHGAAIERNIGKVFDVLMNDEAHSGHVQAAAAELTGEANTRRKDTLVLGSEDFVDMLRVVPGAYCTICQTGDVPLDKAGCAPDDAMLPLGAALLARMVETRGGA